MKKHFLLIGAAALCMACIVACQQTTKGEMAYPQAEWSEAGDILMHTPGAELFNGGRWAAIHRLLVPTRI